MFKERRILAVLPYFYVLLESLHKATIEGGRRMNNADCWSLTIILDTEQLTGPGRDNLQ